MTPDRGKLMKVLAAGYEKRSEARERQPTLTVLQALARALGMKLPDFLLEIETKVLLDSMRPKPRTRRRAGLSRI